MTTNWHPKLVSQWPQRALLQPPADPLPPPADLPQPPADLPQPPADLLQPWLDLVFGVKYECFYSFQNNSNPGWTYSRPSWTYSRPNWTYSSPRWTYPSPSWSYSIAPPPAPPPAPPRQKQTYSIISIIIITCMPHKVGVIFVYICSSSLSLICLCVPTLQLQWLFSPKIPSQHGLSHDTLQCDKKLKGLVIVFKIDSDNRILYILVFNKFLLIPEIL